MQSWAETSDAGRTWKREGREENVWGEGWSCGPGVGPVVGQRFSEQSEESLGHGGSLTALVVVGFAMSSVSTTHTHCGQWPALINVEPHRHTPTAKMSIVLWVYITVLSRVCVYAPSPTTPTTEARSGHSAPAGNHGGRQVSDDRTLALTNAAPSS